MSVDVLFVDDIGLDLIKDRLRRAVAGNSPPDCCIQIGSSPISNTIPNKNTTRLGGV